MKKLLLALMLPAALILSNAVLADDDDDDDDGKKYRFCHNGETIMVSEAAAWAHALRGDERGYCPGDDPGEQPAVAALVILRCNDAEGSVIVQAASGDNSSDMVNPLDEMDEPRNCARALRRLLNAGLELRQTTSGGSGRGLVTEYLLIRD